MPPKFKFTKEQIVDAALDLVRSGGWDALTTRAVGEALGASARPIYSYFDTMEALENAVAKKGVELLYRYMTRERTGDPWHDHGIGYVQFAREEGRLFRCLNDDRHIRYFKRYGEEIWNTLTVSLSGYLPFRGLTEEQVFQIQLSRWLMTHGLAFLVSSSDPGDWDDANIEDTVQQTGAAILEGFKGQFSRNAG